MPSFAASFGPWMLTGWPSKTTSPSSIVWMPAMDLMRVDLPAPLSPTSAMTWPGATWKSTWYRACTAPKLFDTPRSSRMGSLLLTLSLRSRRLRPAGGAARTRRPPMATGLQPGVRAELRELAGADVFLLEEAVVEDDVDVVLRDRLRLEQDGRHLAGRVIGLAVDEAGRRRLLLRQRDRELRGRVGLLLDRLVDGHALVAREDVLDALGRRVLAGDRELLELAGLDRRDGRVAEAVVGGEDAVDLVARLLQHLLEDRQRLLVVPVGHGLVGDLRRLARVVERVEDRVVALREQRGVVVGRRAVELGDLRLGHARLREAVDEALALELADGHVVERHVVVGLALERQAVVVDDLDALGLRVGLDRGARAGVEVDEQDHLRTVGDRLLGLLLLRRLVALGVLDRDRDAGRLERRGQERPVGRLPAHGRLRVGQQPRDLVGRAAAAAATAAATASAASAAAAATGGDDEREGAHRGGQGQHAARDR